MFGKLWRLLGRPALCGAALLTATNLMQAQPSLQIPQPQQVIPAMAVGVPNSGTIIQTGAQEPAPAPRTPALGQPAVQGTPASSTSATNADALKAQLELQQQQIQELMNRLNALQNSGVPTSAPTASTAQGGGLTAKDVQGIINGYFAEKEAQKHYEAHAKATDGYKVGTDLSMSATWQNGVVFSTPNKDFYMRAGFRFQWDNVWFQQSTANASKAPAGVGPQVDGDYWRRIRPNFNGGFWEVGEFNVEIKLENIANGVAGMDDVWVGVKDIPLIGTVRVGHFHLPHGLEADMYSSSKPMTFFEVASANNAFYGGERTGSGIWLTNAFLEQRMTYAAAFYRPENDANGTQFQNGDYAAIGRVTFLPIWQNDGRCFLHLGASATWRKAQGGFASFSTTPEMLDTSGGDNAYGAGAAAATTVTTNPTLANAGGVKLTTAATTTLSGFKAAPGNASAWVSTGNIAADSTTVFATELLYNNGPFSIQSEYLWACINDPFLNGSTGNLGFTGGYIQMGYFLTGESRQYDKRLGRLNADYIARPNTPFWLVRGEDGKFNYGLGAWEVAARFSRLDLNSGAQALGSGIPLVNGGVLDQWEAGVNWHLNNNLRVQFMFLHADRYGFYQAGGAGAAAVPESGWMNGFGIRTQLTF
jgi:phosphate-selective porin OprO/OprP